MKCSNCNYEFPKGNFCPVCGTPVPTSNGTQSSLGLFTEAPASEETYTYTTPKPATEAKTETPIVPVMPVKRKTSRAVIAVILVLVLVAGAVGGILLLGKGPADQIGKAAKKVLDSETFNFDITIKMGDNSVDLNGTVEFKPEEGIFNFYMEGYSEADNSRLKTGIYDGYAFTIVKDEGYDEEYTYNEIDEESMEEFFDYYLEYSDSDLNKEKDVLLILKEIDDLTEGELSEIVNLEILAECITEYVDAHNDKKWLEENAGFSKEKKDGITYYTYEPDLYDFCDVSLPFFEEAFEEDDVYDNCVDAVEDSRGDLKSVNLEISFGVKSGYLTAILMDVEGVEVEMLFSDFGKAELDYDELEDLLSECEEGYKEQWEDYYDDYDYYD